ncbi:hypothetical protein ACLOJK_029540 [Asimina triloba]
MVSKVHQPTAKCLFRSPSSRLTCYLLQQPKLSSINASHNHAGKMLCRWGFMLEVLVVGTVGYAGQWGIDFSMARSGSLVTVRDEVRTGRGSSMSCCLFVIGESYCRMAVMLLPWSGSRCLEAEGLVVVAALPTLGKIVKVLLWHPSPLQSPDLDRLSPQSSDAAGWGGRCSSLEEADGIALSWLKTVLSTSSWMCCCHPLDLTAGLLGRRRADGLLDHDGEDAMDAAVCHRCRDDGGIGIGPSSPCFCLDRIVQSDVRRSFHCRQP